MNPKISVIIPVYNCETFISRCLDSICRQEYQDFETIIIDDGSTDCSGKICDEYAKKDSRFKVFHIENGGPSIARNYGIDHCQGEYICFIDGDDWVNHRYLDQLIHLLRDYDADIACVNHIKTTEYISDDLYSDHIISNRKFSNIELLNQYGNTYHPYLTTVWGKLYNKNLFDNIRFAEGKLHEDIDITYRLFYKSQSIVISDQILYYYWKHPNSITGRVSLKRQMDYLDVQFDKITFLDEIGLSKQSKKQLNILAERYIRTVLLFNISKDKHEEKRYLELSANISKRISLRNIAFSYYMVIKIINISPILISNILYRIIHLFKSGTNQGEN